MCHQFDQDFDTLIINVFYNFLENDEKTRFELTQNEFVDRLWIRYYFFFTLVHAHSLTLLISIHQINSTWAMLSWIWVWSFDFYSSFFKSKAVFATSVEIDYNRLCSSLRCVVHELHRKSSQKDVDIWSAIAIKSRERKSVRVRKNWTLDDMLLKWRRAREKRSIRKKMNWHDENDSMRNTLSQLEQRKFRSFFFDVFFVSTNDQRLFIDFESFSLSISSSWHLSLSMTFQRSSTICSRR